MTPPVTARVRPCGDTALLLDLAGTAEVLAVADALTAAGWPDVVDVVPAARTVLVRTVPGADLDRLHRRLLALAATLHPSTTPGPRDGATVEVPVVYDGPDLDDVARLTGTTADAVVAAHTRAPWRVAFSGFAPGFAYLTGPAGPPVPRHDEPRTSVPAGAVGLAGEFTGIYPRPSPGGWRLIGRTDLAVWDLHRDPPALLLPGTWVRFVAVG